MAVTTYPAANFQDGLTLNMPGGTGTGTSVWTINQDISGLPSTFPFKLLVFDSLGTETTTREIIQVTAKNTGTKQITVSIRGDESTTALDHPNGAMVALVNTAGMENAQNDAIADLYSINSGITAVVSGNAWTALQVLKTEGNHLVKFNGQWLPSNGDILLAASTGTGSDTASTAYKSGTVIGGFGGTLTAGSIYYSDSSANLTTTPGIISIKIGVALTTSTLYFKPEISSLRYTTGTSGAAFNTGDFVYADTAGKWQRITNTTQAGGWAVQVGVALNTVGAADVAVNIAMPNQVISGLSGLVAGTQYYTGTAGALSATKGVNSRSLGIGKSTTELLFITGKDNENVVYETVVAGENWTALELLYFKKSDQRYYRADSDVAESGILEFPALALSTHSGGAGSLQQVIMPGSVAKNYAGFGVGDRLFPSPTTGSYVGNTPASYDTFYRAIGIVGESPKLLFFPENMEFVPTGIQEKGYTGGENHSSTAPVAARFIGWGTNFKKIMVNTPSSITLTAILSYGSTAGPTVSGINRFGFFTELTNTGAGTFTWYGTYQTVGN